MRQLLLSICFFLCISLISGKTVFFKGELPDGIKVSNELLCPMNRCNIFLQEGGGAAFKSVKTYANTLVPDFFAKCEVADNCEFVIVKIESPGHKRWTNNYQIRQANGDFFIDLGQVNLISVPTPTISSIELFESKDSKFFNYQIKFYNPTDKPYYFNEMIATLSIKHDFGSAGMTNSNTASLKYRIEDKLFIRGNGAIFKVEELVNDPQYVKPYSGDIRFFKNKGLIQVEIYLSTSILLPSKGTNYVQLELPKTLTIVNETALIDDSMFEGKSMKLNNFTIKTSVFTFKSKFDDVPPIAKEINHQ